MFLPVTVFSTFSISSREVIFHPMSVIEIAMTAGLKTAEKLLN
jgi:hypothetical protein